MGHCRGHNKFKQCVAAIDKQPTNRGKSRVGFTYVSVPMLFLGTFGKQLNFLDLQIILTLRKINKSLFNFIYSYMNLLYKV